MVVGANVVVVVGANVVVVVGANVVGVVGRWRRVVVVVGTNVVVVVAGDVVDVVGATPVVVEVALGDVVTTCGVVTIVVVEVVTVGVDRVTVVVSGPVVEVTSTTGAGGAATVGGTTRTRGRVVVTGIVVVGAGVGVAARADCDKVTSGEVVARSVDSTGSVLPSPLPSGGTASVATGAEELPTTSISRLEMSVLESGSALLVRAARTTPRLALVPTSTSIAAAAHRRRGRRTEKPGSTVDALRADRLATRPAARRRPGGDTSMRLAPALAPPWSPVPSTASVSPTAGIGVPAPDAPAPDDPAPDEPAARATAPPERAALTALT